MRSFRIEISAGEFLDRLAILHVKRKYLTGQNSQRVLQAEIDALESQGPIPGEWLGCWNALLVIHEQMWINNERRKSHLARSHKPSAVFMELAQQESCLNNTRFLLKDSLNLAVDSNLREQKSMVYVTP